MFLIEVKGDIKIKALGSLHDARWQAGPDPKDPDPEVGPEVEAAEPFWLVALWGWKQKH